MSSISYLSYFLDESTPAYGGMKGSFIKEKTNSIKQGDTSNNLRITFSNHLGTHIDFPRHFSDEGKTCSDYQADFWIFNKVGFLKCSVEEVPFRIQELPDDIELLILKTGFGSKRNETDYWLSQPVIPASFASLFKEKFPFLRVFGFDMISLTSKLDRVEGKKAHLAFLVKYNILVLEDMNISHLHQAPSGVVILPLLLRLADGAPCTVIAYK